ncbi:MAG: hypothetical protein M1820_010519 [Bogoriella megaspora]|nr:MAG: hypothetical protein M1820_010519 [Bogoriella megaspora]
MPKKDFYLTAVTANQANRDSWWNQTAEDWQCCGVDANQNSSCDNPTKETFKGPAPSDLTDLQQIATATQDLLSWQLSSTSAGPSRTGNARPKDTSGGLSTGAKAGIGVGAALGFIIILCAVCFGLYIFKKRRRARNIPEMTPVAAHGFPQEETQSHMQELEAPSKPIGMSARLPKKDNQSLMQELEAPRKPIEMPAQQDEPVELDGGTDGSSSSGHYSNFC